VKSAARQRASSQSRCAPDSVAGLCPPIFPGARLPVCRNRFTQALAVLIATPEPLRGLIARQPITQHGRYDAFQQPRGLGFRLAPATCTPDAIGERV
jgi:hypothetical protein